MIEIWRDIEGFENKYQISSMGEVRSISRTIEDCFGRKRDHKGRVLSKVKDTKGYYTVMLSNKVGKRYHIHRLVAKHFIKNECNKICVNHKDGDKLNNTIDNLEWVTHSENAKHAYEIGLKIYSSRRKADGLHVRSKSGKIRMPDGDILVFKQQQDLVREFGLNSSHLSALLSGKQNSHKGWTRVG